MEYTAPGLKLVVLWPDLLALIGRYHHDIEVVAEALLRRGRVVARQIEVLMGGGWVGIPF